MARSIKTELIDSIDELKERIEVLKSIEGTDLPKNLTDAKARAWFLAIDAVMIQGALHYPDAERFADRTRVVPCRAVMAIIDDFEDKMNSELVSRPSKLIGMRFKAIGEVAGFIDKNGIPLIEGVVAGVAKLWEDLIEEGSDPIEDIAAITGPLTKAFLSLKGVMKAVVFLASNETLSSVIGDVFKWRNDFIASLRRKAFPQPSARRYRRRKLARL